MVESVYIFDPIESDADALQQEAYDFIQAKWPDWEPNEGNLETWLIAACSRMVAEAATVASDVPPAIFRYLGATVMGVAPIDATPATVNSTWTLNSNPGGRTIESGYLVGIEDPDLGVIIFEVVNTVVLGVGVMTTGVGEVTLQAREPGIEGNALGGVGEPAVDVESTAWVATITLTGSTLGGSDGETDDEYLDRLSAELTLLTPRPILPEDYALLAKSMLREEGITGRVLALDGYDAGAGTFGNERVITIAMVEDESGQDVPTEVMNRVSDRLEAMRELNFRVFTSAPTRTSVDVTYAVIKKPGWDPAAVDTATEAAIRSFLSSANWGDDIDTSSREWQRVTAVRHQDVSTVINNVPGVDYWTTLTMGLNGGSQSSTDQQLTGVAPLAQPGNVVGSTS